jgi:4a-hydroxytetrahydrobiopterin dehydratase
MSPEVLSQPQIDAGLAGLQADWVGTTALLRRSIEFANFELAAEFVNRMGPISDEMDHHADLALRWRWVDVVLSTHSAKGVTELDLQLAERIDELVSLLGVPAPEDPPQDSPEDPPEG